MKWVALNEVPLGALRKRILAGELIDDAMANGAATVTAYRAAGGQLWPATDVLVGLAGAATFVAQTKRGQSQWDSPLGGSVSLLAAVLASTNAAAQGSATATPINKARVVVTSLATYTGSGGNVLTMTAAGALAAQDTNVTPALGDVLFVQEGTTNLSAAGDAGPWLVSNAGGTGVQATMTRPWWWTTGNALPQSATIEVGGEGSAYPGTAWKTFAAKGKIIGTDAPVFWPREILYPLTLVAGTLAAPITTIPLRSATASVVTFSRTTLGTPSATIQYGVVPVPTAGVTGSSSIVPMAQVGAGTLNNADTSSLLMSVANW